MTLGLRHAALPAKDLERAIRFYREAFDFEPYHISDKDWAMVTLAGTTLSFIKVPPSAPDVPAPIKGTHPSHVGICATTREEVDTLYQRALPLSRSVGKPAEHRDGSYGFYLLDSEGNQIECIYIPELPTERRQPV